MSNHCPQFHHIAISPVAMEPFSLNCNSKHSPVTMVMCVYLCEALKNHSFIQQYLLSIYHVFITVLDIVGTVVDKTNLNK